MNKLSIVFSILWIVLFAASVVAVLPWATGVAAKVLDICLYVFLGINIPIAVSMIALLIGNRKKKTE